MRHDRPAPREHPATPAWREVHTLYDEGHLRSALQKLLALAATGDPTAPCEIAHIYEIGGADLPIDLQKAHEWYERAASNHSDPQAYVALGRMYYAGSGVAEDHKRALEFFLKGDLENEPGALFAVGLMHALGQGTERSESKALSYFERAAAKGHLLALKNVGVLQFKGGHVLRGAGIYLKAAIQIIWTALTNPESRTLRVQ